MAWGDPSAPVEPETREVGGVRLRRIDDMGELVRVGRNIHSAKALARHWSAGFGFPVSEEVVRAAAVISACWCGEDAPGVEDVVRMSRERGPLLVEMLRACVELNGWDDGSPFGSAGGGNGL